MSDEKPELRVIVEFDTDGDSEAAEHQVSKACVEIERKAMAQWRCGRVHMLTRVPALGVPIPKRTVIVVEWRDEPIPEVPWAEPSPSHPLNPPKLEPGDAILFRRKDHRA